MSLPIRPSETTDFIRCPKYWFYKHCEGWDAPPSAWTPERLMGVAVHAGLAAYWKRKQGIDYPPPEEELHLEFDEGWPWHLDTPREFSREGLEIQSLNVLAATLTWIAANMPDAKPVMVEQPLGADGHTTPDLVTREPGDKGADILAVTDWKTYWNLEPDRVRYRLEGIERTHQFLHYCWAVGEHLKESVTLFRKVVIVGGPKIIVKEATFQPSPAALAQWLTGAQQMWQDMKEMREGTRVAYQREAGCFMYGPKYPCPMYEACWTCHGDRKMMAQFLVKESQ